MLLISDFHPSLTASIWNPANSHLSDWALIVTFYLQKGKVRPHMYKLIIFIVLFFVAWGVIRKLIGSGSHSLPQSSSNGGKERFKGEDVSDGEFKEVEK